MFRRVVREWHYDYRYWVRLTPGLEWLRYEPDFECWEALLAERDNAERGVF